MFGSNRRKYSRCKLIQKPVIFQGNLRNKGYFEGWYYKICSFDGNHVFAIIPGIALNRDPKLSHAFIQILNGSTAEYHYLRFPIEEFKYWRDIHKIQIGPNVFTEKNIDVDIMISNKAHLQGKLEFGSLTPIRSTKLSPGIMGPLSFLPLLETYHGIISMDHTVQGELYYNEEKLEFNAGKGYIEKDWGHSFPSSWIWMQSNNFSESGRSFVFSIAKISYLGLKFTGFFAVFVDHGREYRFSSYNSGKLQELKITDSDVSYKLILPREDIQLEIHAEKPEKYNKQSTSVMMTPANGDMVSKCAETMKAVIRISFLSPNMRFSDVGKHAGCEIMATQGMFNNVEK